MLVPYNTLRDYDYPVPFLNLFLTGSSPRFPLRSHSLVCIKNHLFILGIGPILDKVLEFIYRSDHSDRILIVSYHNILYSKEYI